MTGPELRVIRRELGWNQDQMAEWLDYSVGHYGVLERGEYPIPDRLARQVLLLQCIQRLCKLVGPFAPRRVRASERSEPREG